MTSENVMVFSSIAFLETNITAVKSFSFHRKVRQEDHLKTMSSGSAMRSIADRCNDCTIDVIINISNK